MGNTSRGNRLGSGKGSPRRGRKADGRSAAEVKQEFLELIHQGFRIPEALQKVDRQRATYEGWRKKDPEFVREMDRLRKLHTVRFEPAEEMSFPDFSLKYLGAQVFPHTQNVVDMIEGNEPSWLHPSMDYEKGEPDLVMVNMPPEHPAVFSTPLFTPNRGWITMGEVTDEDWVVAPDGFVAPIAEMWTSPEQVPVFDVVFDSGDVVRTSGEHLWNVYPVRGGVKARNSVRQITTNRLMQEPDKWRVPVGQAWDGQEADLPVDPYLFGYWLGDGCHSKSEFAVGFEDLDAFTGQLDNLGFTYSVSLDSRGRSHVVYVHGLRAGLRETGTFNDPNKRIPQQYFLGSYKQRLALLQGLMDSDGTITVKDSRARFVQHKHDLARDVYRLVASLGMKPHFKKYGDAFEVGFRTTGDPVFRLSRKADRQRPVSGTSKASHRVVKEVRPAGSEFVRCISVLTDSNEYLIGDGMIPTRNGKSAAITVNYVTYRIAMDPNIRVIIVSKTQTMARKFLYAIKTRLTHPKFTEMHVAYGPQGGYDKNSESWSADRIYISSDSRDSGEKDPTVEALGIGSHIYGARADLIVVDDAVDTSNAHQFDKHIDWLQGEVMSRIASTGSMLIVGTRLASRDLYLELRKPERYPDDASPWSYLSMPAVLEYSEHPKDWVTLWPRSNMPEAGDKYAVEDADGLFPKWDGHRLSKKRNRVSPRAWALIYQQQQVSEDMIFTPEMVWGCSNKARTVGPLPSGWAASRANGMSGLVVVAGLDPATTGVTAATVAGLDPITHKRYVLDLRNKAGMRPEELKDMVLELTDKYRIVEWRIEKNAFQGFLVYDQQLNNDLAARGCVIHPHQTGSNKHDTEFGVAAMAGLMTGHETGANLLEFPSLSYGEAAKELGNQLLTWSPQATAKKNHHYDLVMSLWFAMLACQDRDSWGRRASHATGNPFLSPRGEREQSVVNIDEYLAEMERDQFQYEPVGF